MSRLPDPIARRALGLEYATIAVAIGEAVAALVSGVAARSVALTAFGADSVIEMLSAMVVLAQLLSLVRGREIAARREHRAHRSIAALFFALTGYVLVSTVLALTSAVHPSENGLGIAVCLLSGLLMPVLAAAKRRASLHLAHHQPAVSRLLAADATETALCGLLSLSTLAGVVLTAWAGWWWADPIAALAVVWFAVREGLEAWRCEPA